MHIESARYDGGFGTINLLRNTDCRILPDSASFIETDYLLLTFWDSF